MLIIGNTKMNKVSEDYIEGLMSVDTDVSLGLAMPYAYIYKYAETLKKKGIWVGSQNVSFMDTKENTGETSAEIINDVGGQFAVLGHGERRKNFGETGPKIAKKIVDCLNNNLSVIVCVGETREDYERKVTNRVIDRQIREMFRGLTNIDYKKIIVAYEPLWANGTGLTPSNDEIEVIIRQIKSMTSVLIGGESKVIYGGSVKSKNIKMLKSVEGVDGFIVGSSCLDLKSFKEIL